MKYVMAYIAALLLLAGALLSCEIGQETVRPEEKEPAPVILEMNETDRLYRRRRPRTRFRIVTGESETSMITPINVPESASPES